MTESDDIYVMLQEIRGIVDEARAEGRARGALYEHAIIEIREDISRLNKRVSTLESQISKKFSQYDKEITKWRDERSTIKRHAFDLEAKQQQDMHAAQHHVKKLEESIWTMRIEVKKDPWVIIPAIMFAIGIGAFIWFGKISWEIGSAFIITAGIFPSIFGRAKDNNKGDKN